MENKVEEEGLEEKMSRVGDVEGNTVNGRGKIINKAYNHTICLVQTSLGSLSSMSCQVFKTILIPSLSSFLSSSMVSVGSSGMFPRSASIANVGVNL